MKFLLFSCLATLICLGGIEGCIPAGRRVARAVTQDSLEKLREDMKSCIEEKVKKIGSAVDFYVLHSTWFERTDTVACQTDRTKACWQKQLKEINPEYNYLYPVVSACIARYADGMGPHRRQVRSPEIPETYTVGTKTVINPKTMVHCPTLTSFDFKTYLNKKDAKSKITSKTDTTLLEVRDLVAVMQNSIVCSACTCEVIKKNSGSRSFDRTGCEDCWYNRLAASTKSNSPLAKTFAVVAIELGERTSISCIPQTKIILDPQIITKMEVTDLENEIYLGKHKICSNDPAATDVIDPMCKPTIVKNFKGEDTVVFDISSERCLDPTETKTENGNLILTYHITKVPKLNQQLNAQRYTCFTKKMQCKIPMDLTMLYSRAGLSASTKVIIGSAVKGKSEYQLDFQLKGQASVVAGEFVQATINLKNVVDVNNYQVNTGSCWATSVTSSARDVTPKYEIIDCYGCPNIDPQDGSAIEVSNTGDSNVEFKFKAFWWTGKPVDEQKIYLHCEVSICDKKALGTCQKIKCDAKPKKCPNAKKRFRRGIEINEQEHMSIGPIYVRPKRQGTMMSHRTFSVDVN